MSLLYLIAYKPFNVLTQFSGENPAETLQCLDYDFPRDVYPVGRLDKDSEGLLLLSNDKGLNHRLLDPQFKHAREYWAQVEKIPTPEALEKLSQGLRLKDGFTLPAQARLLESEPDLPPRTPPIRYRAQIPTAWLSLTLIEGRNRQVRRMTAAVGFPTLRLVRVRMENLLLGALKPGQVRELTREERQGLLNKLR
ncbi:pseudouridine synthase [bacterium (Candidatus Blackallbacteria) CG17_big_fil_post_rev_8_21_14_2_50_48_46]|uniref:Pseudouridine synthase n=1 Tax=bacterium (Candidatus Blackallbacteria) CG17_big_fil_post_rev_8_21_14_2_50_48_46 TaxID=2014261 RepID=A0A2M7FZR3_9BACT|nr:MAG: pseudouridine synthase [bacterium (Candidatus Blackallbacteria) CG18_big_fil_WC_8_21_14_2_50_49_26]PIW14646.1 MAG: pseudouridine synthase [bacterium (Candidatus Blackallbacteria) CG17_big_fil_post_rev_8_21_14_2_50_48_46]PIW45697.1 MAG: pseudouridine synthase [bacterium (Candidatus Blackallbacteria) CG13_big_fil_rev_8_21_14_2_50_49_14]